MDSSLYYTTTNNVAIIHYHSYMYILLTYDDKSSWGVNTEVL